MSISKPKGTMRSIAVVFLMMLSGVASADYALNMPRGITDISNEVYGLHMLIFWVCVGIAVVVFGAMIVSIVLHRKSRGVEAANFHHNTTIEVVWTIIPFIILILMAWPAAETLIKMEDFRETDMTVKVTGFQWKWRYDYLNADMNSEYGFYSALDGASNAARRKGSGIDPASVENYLLNVDHPLVVPVNTKVRLLITSHDVIHAWWVPALGGKKDAIPGYVQEMWFEANETGMYRGVCAELCGRDHGFMPIVVNVVEQDAFNDWLSGASGNGPAVAEAGAVAAAADDAADREWSMEELMAKGEEVYTTTCASCHQANGEGLPAAGFPAIKGGAIATGDVAAHINMVLHGKTGTPMAAFGGLLSDADIAAVVTYERNAFGNNTGDLVQPSDIKTARQ